LRGGDLVFGWYHKPEIPVCFKILGFKQIPQDRSEVKARYKELIKDAHPDRGGNFAEFVKITKALETSLQYFNGKED
jgi:hypothetical protein